MILNFSWDFKPLRWFSNIEVWPCKEDADGVEQCEPHEAHFWSVYIHYDPSHTPKETDWLNSLPVGLRYDQKELLKIEPEGFEFGGLDCIADCDTEEEANRVKDFLTNLCKNYNGED